MTAAVLRADKENYTVEEVIAKIDESLKEQNHQGKYGQPDLL